jgi:hypothetical protein
MVQEAGALYGVSSFVSCTFTGSTVSKGLVKAGDKSSGTSLEKCTFANNTVLHHELYTEECSSAAPFYSDSALKVWNGCQGSTSTAQPLAALPLSGALTADDPFITGLKQVCAGTAGGV